MIIWIASYPKSGNTWVRAIISSLLYSKDGNHDFSQLEFIEQYPVKKHFKNLLNDFYNLDEIRVVLAYLLTAMSAFLFRKAELHA